MPDTFLAFSNLLVKSCITCHHPQSLPSPMLDLRESCDNCGFSQGHKDTESQLKPTQYFLFLLCAVFSRSVPSDSLQPHRLQPARLFCPWEFSRQKYQSGLPYPPLGDLPNPGMEPRSPTLQEDSLLTEPPGKPFWATFTYKI